MNYSRKDKKMMLKCKSCLKKIYIAFSFSKMGKIMPFIYMICCLPYAVLCVLFRIFPINKNKIVFTCYFGNDYGDNPKYIAEKIISNNLFEDMVWLVSNKNMLHENNLPEKIRPVLYHSWLAIYELSTAQIWVDNARKPIYIRKRKNQIYIQSWHASVSFKKVEADCSDALSPQYISSAKHDSKMCDAIVAGSGHHSNIYKTAFWYNGEILNCGSPRNDILFNQKCEDINKKTDIMLKIFKNKIDSKVHLVLYAPTFRKDGGLEIYNLDYHKCQLTLKNKFGGEWIFLVRLHPNIAAISAGLHINTNDIYDVSKYPDMQELLCVSDVLITDYSSSSFDYLTTKRPCFLYTPDYDEYMKDRGLYFCLDDLPFPRANDNDELFEQINHFDVNEYRAGVESFTKEIQVYNSGHAASDVVDWIKKKLET